MKQKWNAGVCPQDFRNLKDIRIYFFVHIPFPVLCVYAYFLSKNMPIFNMKAQITRNSDAIKEKHMGLFMTVNNNCVKITTKSTQNKYIALTQREVTL